jgi:23S rRNA (cytidine2498-2'-O)-methyltransferase
VHCFYTDPDCEDLLIAELQRRYPTGKPRVIAPQLVQGEADLAHPLTFSRQALPLAEAIQRPSIGAWAALIVEQLMARVPEQSSWRLHVVPSYGEGLAGMNRCNLIIKSVKERLAKQRRVYLRSLKDSTERWQDGESLVQLCLTSPEDGWLSICAAPLLTDYRCNVWPMPLGEIPVAVDKSAPSRAFTKVVETEQRLGIMIDKGQTCVDLGACPGSWTYVAVHRGAKVVSVDRSPLREDLMAHRRVEFIQGDAFKFQPTEPVDWLLCDVIASPERSIALLTEWLQKGWARRFIVSIKFKGSEDYPLLDGLQAAVRPLCTEFYLARLCANKNEACAFGIAL